jgi:hypothetical protein
LPTLGSPTPGLPTPGLPTPGLPTPGLPTQRDAEDAFNRLLNRGLESGQQRVRGGSL